MKQLFLLITFIILIIGCTSIADNNINNTCIEDKNNECSFSIIIIPDSQRYISNESNNEIFKNQIQWIVNNKDNLNIKFVIHEGDIVDNANSIHQWEIVNKSLSILDNKIPYSVVPGNHDQPTTNYNKYFPVSRFSNNSWWGGNYSENDNNYQLMTIGKDDYLFISLNWCPSNDELIWANDVLTNHTDRKTILTTHAYLDDNTSTRTNLRGCSDTNYIWNDLIKYHENLQIVLSGHEHDIGGDGEAYKVDYNLAGKPVHQILADYQDYPRGGEGWLRILEFNRLEDKIYVKTYSTYLNIFDTDNTGQFSFDYDIN